MEIAQRMLTTFKFQFCLKKLYLVTNHGCTAMTLKPKPNHPHGSVQKSQDRKVRSNLKDLLTVFFDCNGMVHHEFLPQGRTVNQEQYLEVMHRLREAVRQKRTELWKNQSWIFHHDNAPAHTSMLVREFLAKNKTVFMPQPPYSPDLDPLTFSSYPNP